MLRFISVLFSCAFAFWRCERRRNIFTRRKYCPSGQMDCARPQDSCIDWYEVRGGPNIRDSNVYRTMQRESPNHSTYWPWVVCNAAGQRNNQRVEDLLNGHGIGSARFKEVCETTCACGGLLHGQYYSMGPRNRESGLQIFFSNSPVPGGGFALQQDTFLQQCGEFRRLGSGKVCIELNNHKFSSPRNNAGSAFRKEASEFCFDDRCSEDGVAGCTVEIDDSGSSYCSTSPTSSSLQSASRGGMFQYQAYVCGNACVSGTNAECGSGEFCNARICWRCQDVYDSCQSSSNVFDPYNCEERCNGRRRRTSTEILNTRQLLTKQAEKL